MTICSWFLRFFSNFIRGMKFFLESMPLNYILPVQLSIRLQCLVYQTPAPQDGPMVTSSYSPSLAFRERAGSHMPVGEEIFINCQTTRKLMQLEPSGLVHALLLFILKVIKHSVVNIIIGLKWRNNEPLSLFFYLS